MSCTTPSAALAAAPERAVWPSLLLATLGAIAIAIAIAFSGKATIVKLAYRHGVDAVTLIADRMLFALPLSCCSHGGRAGASRR